MMKLITLIGAIVLLFTLIVLWRIFLMPTIENSSYICTLYTPEEYKEILSYDDLEIYDMKNIDTVPLDLHFEFPFKFPEDSRLLINILSFKLDANIYYNHIPKTGKIQVHIPPPSKYPRTYIWNFSLFIPSKQAICVWGLEEDMYLMDEDFPRSWRVKLLTERIAKEHGGGRTTIFEPM